MKHQDRTASPESLGLDPAKLARLFERAGREMRGGLLPSCQLAVARHGKLAAVRTFGAADDDTLYVIFSCTKAITSAAAWILLEEGKLALDERVADVLPGFASNGKDAVTRRAALHAYRRLPARAARSACRRLADAAASTSGAGASTGSRARASSTTRRRACG